jgi:hypothetical protein
MFVSLGNNMICMKKRRPKNNSGCRSFVTAGGKVPVKMKADYDRKVVTVGLQKQRALAAALQAFIDADSKQILEWFQRAHESYVKAALQDEGVDGLSEREGKLADGSRSALKDLRASEEQTPPKSGQHSAGSRRATHG